MTASEISHPTEDLGTGTVPDLAADVVDVATVETVRSAEVEVVVGEIVQPQTPPHQEVQKNRGGGQNGQEGGRSAYNDGLMGMGSSVRPAVRRPHEKLGTAIGHPQRGQ